MHGRALSLLAAGALALAACGGSAASGRGPVRGGGAGARDGRDAAAAAAAGAEPDPAEDPLAALAGTYQPVGSPFPQVELATDGSYLLRRGERPGDQERGTASLEGSVLTLVPAIIGGTSRDTELAVRRHGERVVLLRGDERDAFDLVASLQLGMLRRLPSDPPGAIVLPQTEPAPNPAGPNGEPPLPASFRVLVTFPAGAPHRSARVLVTTAPHGIEVQGCETRDPTRECGGPLRRRLGAASWVEVTRLWWSIQPPTGCADGGEVGGQFRVVAPGRELTGALPADPTDEALAGPCYTAARFAWWFARQVSLR